MSREIREEARRREEERQAVERRREEFGADLRAIAARPEGQRFLRWLLDRGGMFAEDWTPDATAAAFAAGKKASAVSLWNLLRRHLPRAAFVEVALPGEPEDESRRVADGTQAPGSY